MTNELTVTSQQLPAVRTLIAGTVDVAAYQQTVLREAHQRVVTRQRAIDAAEQQIADAERGLAAADYAGIDTQAQMFRNVIYRRSYSRTRRLRQFESAKKFLSLVEDGYLPIPVLPDAFPVRWLRDPLPPEVLETIGAEQLHERFSEFQVVGMAPEWQRGRRRRHNDPILVGLCDGEMFALAWWR